MNIRRTGPHLSRIYFNSWTFGVLALLIACATLVAGTIPFGAPRNEVAPAKGENGICFGRYGMALSSRPLLLTGDGSGGSVELWVQPARTWAIGSILTFYGVSESREFRLEQDYTDLVLRLGDDELKTEDGRRVVRIENVFRKKQAFITVTSDGQETSVYIDGQVAARSPDFKLPRKDLSGQLILANSPFRSHSWQGIVKGIAVYGTKLDGTQALRHYQNWTERGEPLPQDTDQIRALFLFRDRLSGDIQNMVAGGTNLEVPGKFVVVDQLRFEPPLSEYRSQRTYLENAIFNIAGFMPFGFALSLYMASFSKIRRELFLIALAGMALSLVIEYSQSFQPTRYSGCTDLFTNTIGTWIGAVAGKWLAGWVHSHKSSPEPSPIESFS